MPAIPWAVVTVRHSSDVNDGSDGNDGHEGWLVELTAERSAGFDLDDDVALVSALWNLGTTGVAELDGRLVAGFDHRADAEAAVEALDRREEIRSVSCKPYEARAVEGRGSEESTAVELDVAGTTHRIEIVTGPTFGHGGHPTTRLALLLLADALEAVFERRSPDQVRLLDMGTGSGVVAVMAARAGVGSVTAVDIDPRCRAVVEENAYANGVTVEAIIASGGPSMGRSLQPVSEFDVVVANMLLVDQTTVADYISRVLAPDGQLVVCGHLQDQADRLLALHPQMTPSSHRSVDDWVGHLLAARSRPG